MYIFHNNKTIFHSKRFFSNSESDNKGRGLNKGRTQLRLGDRTDVQRSSGRYAAGLAPPVSRWLNGSSIWTLRPVLFPSFPFRPRPTRKWNERRPERPHAAPVSLFPSLPLGNGRSYPGTSRAHRVCYLVLRFRRQNSRHPDAAADIDDGHRKPGVFSISAIVFEIDRFDSAHQSVFPLTRRERERVVPKKQLQTRELKISGHHRTGRTGGKKNLFDSVFRTEVPTFHLIVLHDGRRVNRFKRFTYYACAARLNEFVFRVFRFASFTIWIIHKSFF